VITADIAMDTLTSVRPIVHLKPICRGQPGSSLLPMPVGQVSDRSGRQSAFAV